MDPDVIPLTSVVLRPILTLTSVLPDPDGVWVRTFKTPETTTSTFPDLRVETRSRDSVAVRKGPPTRVCGRTRTVPTVRVNGEDFRFSSLYFT